MKKLQKILIPIDFSPVALNAVNYAAGILEKDLAEVVLVYVNQQLNPRSEADIKREFRTFEMKALQNVSFYYEFEVLNGNLLNELISATKKHAPDLIIFGSKGQRESDVSLAASLIRSVFCPVIVVPEQNKKYQLNKIAFANDYKPIPDSEAIKPLWELALTSRAKVYLFHINHSKKEVLVPYDDAESTLEYYLQSVDHEYAYLINDNVELAINQFIQTRKIDLLVILSRDHGNNQLKSEGKLIAQLAAHAEIPILILC